MFRVILILCVTFLASCDCYQVVTGSVVDKDSGKAIDGATVYNKVKALNKTETDSTGQFEISNISGGLSCPPMTVIIQKKNYKSLEVIIPAGGRETIKLEAIEVSANSRAKYQIH